MGKFGPGVVVLVRFPFSDLSASKLRPALVVARAGVSDWVLCQITSNAYGDPMSLAISQDSFAAGRPHARQLCSARQTLHSQRGHRSPIGRATFLGGPSRRCRGHRGATPRRGPISGPSNNGLHQTGRGGVALAFRRRPVVEARPAGEAGCWTDHRRAKHPAAMVTL